MNTSLLNELQEVYMEIQQLTEEYTQSTKPILFETKYERWPWTGEEYTEGYPSWVLYKNKKPVAAIANDGDKYYVIIRDIKTIIRGKGYGEELIHLLLDEGVSIQTGRPKYNSISPSMYKLINRINNQKDIWGIKSKKLGPADNTGKNYKELENLDVYHYLWWKKN